MSRALDPQLHTHVVAANMTRGPDGRFTALFGAPLYRAAKTGGYLYQAHLRAEISERLGLEWGPVGKGAAELKEIPASVLEEFSRRRHEMQRAAAEGGFSLGTKRSAEAAAVDTRERKQYGIETHTWREEIQARAGEHGLDRQEVGRVLARGQKRRGREGRSSLSDAATASPTDVVGSVPAADVARLADRLAGEHGLTERSNTFDERDVLQGFAQAAGQGATVEQVRGRADWFAGRDDVLRTRGGDMTTQDLVSCEQQLIDAAAGRVGAGCAVVSERTIERALAGADRPLTEEQELAVRESAGSGHGVQVIEALAGTGKTYTAGVLRAVYDNAGYRVIGLAPTGRGARELTDEAGIPAWTIDRALIDIEEHGAGIPKRSVIVLDEAGMAPTRLTNGAAPGARRLGGGEGDRDRRFGTAAVGARRWLAARGRRPGRGAQAHRSHETAGPGRASRSRSTSRRGPGPLHGVGPRRERIDVVSGGQLVERAVEEWIPAAAEHGPGQAVMIARDNDIRSQLNEAARAHRTEAGEIGEEHLFGGTPVAVGDRVICRNNDARVGVDNGTRGTVRHVDGSCVVLDTTAELFASCRPATSPTMLSTRTA